MPKKQTFPLLSWSKIKLFKQCQRCFYKDLFLDIKRPEIDIEQFSLNNIIDELWKKELNIYRKQQMPHPLLANQTNNAVPLAHESLEDWKNYKKGIRSIDPINQFELCGVIDDLLINNNDELVVIDYKSTANPLNVTCDRRTLTVYYNHAQISFYAYLLKKNNFTVNKTAHLIYNLALNNRSDFQQKLEFEISILPCQIDYSWIEPTLQAAYKCLRQGHIPAPSKWCKYCACELGIVLTKSNSSSYSIHYGRKI